MADAYKLNGESKWRNRIQGVGEESPDQLLPHPDNPKIHPKLQQDMLAGALGEIGWIAMPTVNTTTGHLIDGHARVVLAIRNEEPSIPVLYVTLTEEEEKLALATLDPIAALAVRDEEKLAPLLKDIETADADLRSLLQQMAKDARLDIDYDVPDPAPVEEPDIPAGRVVELRCSDTALDFIMPTLRQWDKRTDVTINIS